MERNDRNILVLGILILILLVIGYYFLLLSPLRQEYASAFEERTRKEAQERQLDQTVAQLENVRRDAPNIERQILEYSKRLPSQDEIPTLVVQIEEIAREAGVTQLSIEPGSPEAPPGGGDFSRIPITMSFEGTYDDLQDFTLRLRNLARLVTINEVTYEEAEQAGEATGVDEDIEDLLTVTLLAETYVQPAAGEDTGGEATGAAAPAGEGKAATKTGDSKAGTKAGGGKAGGDKAGGGKSQ